MRMVQSRAWFGMHEMIRDATRYHTLLKSHTHTDPRTPTHPHDLNPNLKPPPQTPHNQVFLFDDDGDWADKMDDEAEVCASSVCVCACVCVSVRLLVLCSKLYPAT